MNTLAADITGGQFLGAVTMSGLALAAAVVLIAGIRGSDRIKINTRDRAGGLGIVTGIFWVAAGGFWADLAQGISSAPASVLGPGGPFGNPGLGGSALILTLLTFLPGWKKLLWPALLGIAAGVVYGQAGGLWSVGVGIVKSLVATITGSA